MPIWYQYHHQKPSNPAGLEFKKILLSILHFHNPIQDYEIQISTDLAQEEC